MKVCTFEYYRRRYGDKCFYCGEKLNHVTATRDHYIPRILGGKGNIRLACKFCNTQKGGLPPQDYLTKIRHLFFNYYQRELCRIKT